MMLESSYFLTEPVCSPVECEQPARAGQLQPADADQDLPRLLPPRRGQKKRKPRRRPPRRSREICLQRENFQGRAPIIRYPYFIYTSVHIVLE